MAMKYASLILTMIVLGACANHYTHIETPEEAAARAERQRIAAEEWAKRQAAEEERLAKAKENEKFGTTRANFDKYHSPPDEVEMVNGMTVYWYNSTETPMYFMFKNDKLVSAVVDRETLRERKENEARRERLASERADRAQKERFQRALLWQNAFKNNRTKTTNCTSNQVFGTVNTTCREN